jgi:hypothetical protein
MRHQLRSDQCNGSMTVGRATLGKRQLVGDNWLTTYC